MEENDSIAEKVAEVSTEEPETEQETAKSSNELLEEIFDAFLSEKSKKKKKEKHKKKDKHKKKKKHKDKDKDGDSDKKERKKDKEHKSKHKDKLSSPKSFYEASEATEIAKNLESGVKFDAGKCDLYATGELDSDEEKALSFDCFVEKSDSSENVTDFTEKAATKRQSSDKDGKESPIKKRMIEIQDLKKCSVSDLLTKKDKVKSSKRSKNYEDGELSSSSGERTSSRKHGRRDQTSARDKDSKTDRSGSRKSHDRGSSSNSHQHYARRGAERGDRSREDWSSRRGKESERLHERESGRSKSSPHPAHSRRDRRREEERIDKKKLLAIAKKNATYLLKEQQERMLQAGVIPLGSVSNKAGKSVAELTEYCKKLVKSGSGSSDSDSDSELSTGEGPTDSFIHHPFTLRDRPNTIVMNIRNATQLPTKSMQEKAAESSKIRSLQYPVSSGQQHRSTEWVPVSPLAITAPPTSSESAPSTTKPSAAVTAMTASCTDTSGNVDISSLISQKLSAMRKMQESSRIVSHNYGYGPGSNLSSLSGAFTGNTGVKLLTPAELASGQQAWARKDQLKTAAPVAGGMGMKLLQKMGWRPGEGLGKNKEGGLEPLNLDVKMDKKGLVAPEECRTRFQPFTGGTKKKGGGGGPGVPDETPAAGGHEVFSGKHPVSALVELCTKRRWGSPGFELVFESGPDHKKNFLFKVKVNGMEYQDQIAYGNKKQAKAMAAQHCLLALGLVVKV